MTQMNLTMKQTDSQNRETDLWLWVRVQWEGLGVGGQQMQTSVQNG